MPSKPDKINAASREQLKNAQEILKSDETKLADVVRAFVGELQNNVAKHPEFGALQKRYEDISRDIVWEEISDEQKEKFLDFINDVSRALEDAGLLEEEGNEAGGIESEGVDQAVIRRTERSIEAAGYADDLKEGRDLPENAEKAAAAIIGREYWGNMLGTLKKGDRLVSILVPGADFLKIKHLNDVVFSPTITDGILKKKRDLVKEKMESLGGKVLLNDYKSDFISLPEGSDVGLEQISRAMEEIDENITIYILDLISSLIKTADEKKKAVLLDFKHQLTKNKRGYKLNFGLTDVGGDSADDKLWAIAKASQTCLTGREKNEYGSEADEQETISEVGAIKELRERIVEGGNTVEDADGHAFAIFTQAEDGKWVINRDVLRDVRKGKFKSGRGFEAVSLDIKQYVKKINVIDSVKPFILEEVRGQGGVEERIRENREIAGNVNGHKTAAAEKLDTDEKDERFTSRDRFNKMATEMPNCRYVSIDVLDLGVDQLQEYESLLQQVEAAPDEKKIKTLKEVSLRAGDETTKRLRVFREIVARVIKEKLPELKNEKRILGSVGGDELMLAFDGEKISQAKVEEIVFAIKSELKRDESSKIEIRVAIAETHKNVGTDISDKEKVEAHVGAIDKTEKANVLAKEIEDAARKLNFKKIKAGGIGGIADLSEELAGIMVVSERGGEINFEPSCIVVEESGKFIVTNGSKKEEYGVLEKRLKEIIGRMSAGKEERGVVAAA